MKKIIKFAIIIASILQINGLHGQAHISVESLIGFPDTANYNQQYTFSTFLHNYDTTLYSGNISIHLHTDTLNSGNLVLWSGQIQINPDSFLSISISGFSFDSASFRTGGNVVVVWPVSNSGTMITVTDTFYTYVDILGYAGLSDIIPDNYYYNIYPVPASDILFLPENIAENDVEYVRILDIIGRQKYFSEKAITSINTSLLEQGVYFIEIKEKNKTTKISKFIISR